MLQISWNFLSFHHMALTLWGSGQCYPRGFLDFQRKRLPLRVIKLSASWVNPLSLHKNMPQWVSYIVFTTMWIIMNSFQFPLDSVPGIVSLQTLWPIFGQVHFNYQTVKGRFMVWLRILFLSINLDGMKH